ncbi:MAG: KEOPS complex subunit Cgi121, partial [Halolamina sp.]
MELVEGIARIDDLDRFLERRGEIGDEHGCTIQAFDARYVAGRRHLER